LLSGRHRADPCVGLARAGSPCHVAWQSWPCCAAVGSAMEAPAAPKMARCRRTPPGGYALNAKTNPRSILESTRVLKNEPKTNLNEPKTNPSLIYGRLVKSLIISTPVSARRNPGQGFLSDRRRAHPRVGLARAGSPCHVAWPSWPCCVTVGSVVAGSGNALNGAANWRHPPGGYALNAKTNPGWIFWDSDKSFTISVGTNAGEFVVESFKARKDMARPRLNRCMAQ